MKFGQVPENELNKVDFSLLPEPRGNGKVLGGKRPDTVKVYVGCAKWGADSWSGKLYPAGTKEKDYTGQYVQQFNCIEFNATHYKIYEPAVLERWTEKAKGHDFLFCPKMFNGITHRGSLLDKQAVMDEYLSSITTLQEHMGPVFIQLSDSFGPERSNELFTWLQSLSSDVLFFLEVRHPEWFSNDKSRSALFNRLYLSGIGAVITDTAGRRDCTHMHVTVPKTFVRFVGNGLHPTDYTRVDGWVERIRHWIDNGLQDLYFFIHGKHDEGLPDLAVYLAEKLNVACGLQLKAPDVKEEKPGAKDVQIKLF